MKRTTLAAWCMGAGCGALSVGAFLAFGVGVGVMVSGLALVGVAVLLGWDN